MPASYFLDSNVFIYFLDDDEPEKQAVASSLIRRAIEYGDGCISSQVISEVLNVATKVGASRLSTEEASRFLGDVLEPIHLVRPTRQLFERALRIRERYGINFYDSLIVAGRMRVRVHHSLHRRSPTWPGLRSGSGRESVWLTAFSSPSLARCTSGDGTRSLLRACAPTGRRACRRGGRPVRQRPRSQAGAVSPPPPPEATGPRDSPG